MRGMPGKIGCDPRGLVAKAQVLFRIEKDPFETTVKEADGAFRTAEAAARAPVLRRSILGLVAAGSLGVGGGMRAAAVAGIFVTPAR